MGVVNKMSETILPIGVRLLSEEAKLPVYSTTGAAGCDIFATEDFTVLPAYVDYQSDKELKRVNYYAQEEMAFWIKTQETVRKGIKKKYKKLIKKEEQKSKKRMLKDMYAVELSQVESEYQFRLFNGMLTEFMQKTQVKFGTYVTKVGIAFDIPEGSNIELEIRGRSGLAFKSEIMGFNGTLDEDYKGELAIKLWNLGTEPVHFKKGDRIAQGVFKKVIQADFLDPHRLPYNEEDKETIAKREDLGNIRKVERGEGWAGSTGLSDNGREVQGTVEYGIAESPPIKQVTNTEQEYFVQPPKEEKLYAFAPQNENDVDADSELIKITSEEAVSEIVQEVQEITEDDLPFKKEETVTQKQLAEEAQVAKNIAEYEKEVEQMVTEETVVTKETEGNVDKAKVIDELLKNEELIDAFILLDVAGKKNVNIHFADKVLLKLASTQKVEEQWIIDTNYYRTDGTLIELKLRVPKENKGDYSLVALFNSNTVEDGELSYNNLIVESTVAQVAVQYADSKEKTVYRQQEVGVSKTLDETNVLLGKLYVVVEEVEDLTNIESVEVNLKVKDDETDILFLKGFVRSVERVNKDEYTFDILFKLDGYSHINKSVVGGVLTLDTIKSLGAGIDSIYFSETTVNGSHSYREVVGEECNLRITSVGKLNKVEYNSQSANLNVPMK